MMADAIAETLMNLKSKGGMIALTHEEMIDDSFMFQIQSYSKIGYLQISTDHMKGETLVAITKEGEKALEQWKAEKSEQLTTGQKAFNQVKELMHSMKTDNLHELVLLATSELTSRAKKSKE